MTEREQARAELKKQLNSYRELRAEHRQIREELEAMETDMGLTGSNYDGMPRGSSTSDPTGRLAGVHLALQERYKAQLEKLADGQTVIENMIEGLEPTERRLARFRYIDGLSWEDVCEQMNYSWRQTHRIHGRMLDKLLTAELERRNTQKCD